MPGSTSQPLRVLFATAEYAPISQVGGLAAASQGLVAELRHQGVEVEVVTPDYADVVLTNERVTTLDLPGFAGEGRARSGSHAAAGDVTLIDAAGLRREHPYLQPDGIGWLDNDRRFIGFSCAIAELVRHRKPDIVHLNDWHTAATLGFLNERPPVVLTIHTAGYQGACDVSWLEVFTDHPNSYRHDMSCNPLAGGIDLAESVLTVSPTYAAEICTPEGGAGLHDVLRANGLIGIRNGIDVARWNPRTDPALTDHFGPADLAGKRAARARLHGELDLVDDGSPLIVSVGRLADQKGIDLLLPLIDLLDGIGARLAILGSGDRLLSESLQTAATAHPDRLWFRDGYDEGLAHRMFAGGDLFVMPSRFEPCGLAQMQALAYGTMPVVTAVGGLVDTVIDADVDSAGGNGFVARVVDSVHLLDALHRGVRAWRDPIRRDVIQRRGMTEDWSWTQPAAEHVALYRRLVHERSVTS